MGLGAAIATVLLSGVVAALVSFLLNATKEEVAASQRRAEELYKLFSYVDKQLTAKYLNWMLYLSEKATRAEYLTASSLDKAENVGRDVDAVEMMINFYFPSLVSKWEDYLAARDKIGALMFEAERDPSKKPDYDKAVMGLQVPGEALRKAIVAEGQHYAQISVLRRARGLQ